MNGLEQPLERLNYFNGQRLDAADFRLEQEYHMRVRRWLNKSLYTSGIAAGLEVRGKKTIVNGKEVPPHQVIISPGLALDAEGREILLLEPREVQVVGVPNPTAGVVNGNYLVIQYAEAKTAPVEEGCAVQLKGSCATRDLAWGAPSRIRAEPVVQIHDTWPAEVTGKIILAQLELDDQCAVRAIHTGARKYAAASKSARVRALSLEGEKDIDANNAKVLYFHIDGGYPDSVTLYLRAAQFSTLFYTEIGRHTHQLHIQLQSAPAIVAHSHPLGQLQTDDFHAHAHTINANTQETKAENNALELDPADQHGTNLNTQVQMTVSLEAEHHHVIAAGGSTNLSGALPPHNHPPTLAIADTFGALPAARSGPALNHINGLRIIFDGTNDVTDKVLAQLAGRDGPNIWASLGNGLAGHRLVTQGSGPIDLISMDLNFSPGEHSLTFSVPSGGGQIHYNLYVE